MTTGLNDINTHTPVAEIIRRILAEQTQPITVGELTTLVMDAWSRYLPENPFGDEVVVYQIAVTVLHCDVSYARLPNEQPPYAERAIPGVEPEAVNPRMSSEILAEMSDDIAQILVSLPKH